MQLSRSGSTSRSNDISISSTDQAHEAMHPDSPVLQAQVEISESESEDDKKSFSAILASIQHDRIPHMCLKVRNDMREKFPENLPEHELPLVEEPIFGSSHVLFPIQFRDSLKWVLKVPAHGTLGSWDEDRSKSLTAEALTMKFLRRNTSIPLAEIFAYDPSLDNELACPFILMNFVNGISLYDCWFNKKSDEVGKHREQALKDIATAMAQLGRVAFDNGGSLIFDETGVPVSTGQVRCIDWKATLDRMFSDDETEEVEETCYFTAGPFSTAKSYYTHSLDQQPEPNSTWNKGTRKLLYLFMDWIPDVCDQQKGFVLAHPDFDIQNFVVSEDGHLQAIIDWDGVMAVPRSVGNESYPGFLTRDWDPSMYGWSEEMERGEEPKGVWEDSPSTLAQHRHDYGQYMRLALSREGKENNKSQTSEENGAQVSSRTANSLYVENLIIATCNPVCTFEILEKFVEKINELLDVEEGEEFDIFDLINELGDEELEEKRFKLLKRGFQAMFHT